MSTHYSRRLYASMLVSLDGYIEGPNGELDWFDESNEQFQQYCDEMVDSVGLALYGRRSYELMLAYWPRAEAEPRSEQELVFAKKMNALQKVVLSTTLQRAEWSNTRIITDRVLDQLRELKQQPGKPIVAWAGASLLRTLFEGRLIDELRLIVQPVVLGGGTPLFKDARCVPKLHLVRTMQLGASVAVLCYEPRWS